jgi:fructose-1,6-bisphosphatase/inositol monophosphatase family enzyme
MSQPHHSSGEATEGAPDLIALLYETCIIGASALMRHDQNVGSNTPDRIKALAPTQKDPTDPRTVVTQADLESERAIVAYLSGKLHCSFLSEEAGSIKPKRPSPFRAIVDSLDGSKNFLAGSLGLYAISIALEHNGDLVAGAVALPRFNRALIAERGRGVFLVTLDGTESPSSSHQLKIGGSEEVTLNRARLYVSRGSGAATSLLEAPLSDVLRNV